jgi:hypothetical protein
LKNNSGKMGFLLQILLVICYLGGVLARLNHIVVNIIWFLLTIASIILGVFSLIKNKSILIRPLIIICIGIILFMFGMFGLFLDSM